MKTYKVKAWGKEYEVSPRVTKYCTDGGLAIVLDYFDEEMQGWLPYCNLTVNLGRMNYGFAYVDTNNCPWATSFIEENGFGKFTGKTCNSGWCEYPLYEFDMEKLKDAG